jgi:hypothetical protein
MFFEDVVKANMVGWIHLDEPHADVGSGLASHDRIAVRWVARSRVLVDLDAVACPTAVV